MTKPRSQNLTLLSYTHLVGKENMDSLFETVLKPYANKVEFPRGARIYGKNARIELFEEKEPGEAPYATFERSTTRLLLEISDLIQFGIARAYFASAWADKQDEAPDGMNLSGLEIFDVMPEETAPEALEAAEALAAGLCQCNGVASLAELYARAEALPRGKYADRDLAPELFGHYLGMEAMGHGVGLESFGLESIDGGILRTGETLKVVGSKEAIAVPYLGSIVL